jgi:hypothetical protein
VSTLEAVRDELRRAIAAIAGDYLRSGAFVDVDAEGWREREAEIDAAFAAGDVARARTAIAAWLRFALAELREETFEEASRDG